MYTYIVFFNLKKGSLHEQSATLQEEKIVSYYVNSSLYFLVAFVLDKFRIQFLVFVKKNSTSRRTILSVFFKVYE